MLWHYRFLAAKALCLLTAVKAGRLEQIDKEDSCLEK